MIRIINRESYALLLAQYQPKVIETEAENEAAIAIAQELEHRNRTPEEDVFLELLLTLIEKFEEEHYQFLDSTSQSILLHLMEARSIQPKDLIGVIGSSGMVSEIINGQRLIDKTIAKALGEYFHVSPELFI